MDARIDAFRSVRGATHFELTKNFNAYARALDAEAFDVDAFFAALSPKNTGEEYLRVKLLRKFKRYDDLLDALVTGPVMFIKLILSDPELVRYVSVGYTGEALLRLFARGCYKIRAKLVNKLAFAVRDELKAREFYAAVAGAYGAKAAKPLLVACAESDIIRAIREDEIALTHAELRSCFTRGKSDTLRAHFERWKNFDKFAKLARLICAHDIQLFHALTAYGFPRLGRNSLKRYLRVYKGEFIADGEKTRAISINNFKWRGLTEQEMMVWCGNLLPESATSVFWDFPHFLRMLPLRERGGVFFKAFRAKYGYDAWEFKDEYAEISGVISVLALDDRRKFDLTGDNVQYDSVEIAMPILNNQLKLADQSSKRLSIMRMILTNCKCNNDYAELLRVMEKFARHQKNELKPFRAAVIGQIADFNARKFTAAHWDCVDRIIRHYYVNSEYEYYLNDINAAYIKHLMSQGKDYEFNLRMLFKTGGVYFRYDYAFPAEHEREILLKYRECMTEMFADDTQAAHMNFIAYALRLNNKNRKRKVLQIPLGPYMDSLRVIADDYKNHYSSFHELAKLLSCLRNAGEEFDEVLDLLMAACFKKGETHVQNWFLNNRPELLAANLCALFAAGKIRPAFLYTLHKLDSPLKVKVVEYALDVLSKPDGRDCAEVRNSITLLSPAWDHACEDYTKRWNGLEVVADTQCAKETYEIKKALLNSCKYRYDLRAAIPLVLQHLSGDYLKHALVPLYYIAANLPESELIAPLQQVAQRGVSARKHALLIVAYIATLRWKRSVLARFAADEKDASVRKSVLRILCRCLQDDRTETDWTFFKAHLHFIDPDDKDIERFIRADKIPRKFYTEFVAMMHERLKARADHEEFILIECLDNQKFDFANPIAREMIAHAFLNADNANATATHEFIFNYIASDALRERLEFIESCVHERCTRAQQHDREKLRKSLWDFYAQCCARLLKPASDKTTQQDEKTALGVIEMMRDTQPNAAIRLLLDATLAYKTGAHFTRGIHQKLNELISKHGASAGNAYAKILGYLARLLDSETLLIDLVEGILEEDGGGECAVAVRSFCVALLPDAVPKNTSYREKYFKILAKLRDGCEVIGIDVDAYIYGVTF